MSRPRVGEAFGREAGSLGERVSFGYALVRLLARFLTFLFYERVEVVGAEAVPATGPVIVAANHHNSVVDALLLLAVIPRRLRTLANAPLFRHPLIGPFLRLLGALPVHRRTESGDDPARNEALFTATTATLRAGGAILIFPEGRTQPEPVLLELRTGAARMLLAAQTGSVGSSAVTLLPVGLVFHEPGTFRTGRALILIGEPVSTADCQATGEGTESFARRLTDRLAEALRGRFVEANDRQTLRLLGVVEDLWQEEAGEVSRAPAARVAWLQRAMRTYRELLVRAPERVTMFRRDLDAFCSELERAGLASTRIPPVQTVGSIGRFAAREAFALTFGLPVALYGILAHGIPYRLTGVIVRRLGRTDEEEATDKLAVGLLFYPLLWALEACCVLWLGGSWAALVFLALLPPSGFFALAWRERLDRIRREARSFVRFWRDRDLRGRLLDRRRVLAAELAALARLVPKVWAE